METIQILTIGDPHFMVSNIEQCKEMMQKTYTLLDNHSFDIIVVLGDILHTHEKVHVSPFKLAIDFLKSLSEYAPTFLLIGNHDYINNQQFLTDNHAFNGLKGYPDIYIVDQVETLTIHDHLFVFVPYVPPNRFIEALNTTSCDWKKATAIFAHQEFYGCQLNPLVKSSEGDIWNEDYPMVISGHIHNSQFLQNNIYYVGSAMQHSFGESANKSHALISIIQNEDPTKHNVNNNDNVTITPIDLKLTKKIILYKNINELDDIQLPQNSIIKLVIRAQADEIKQYKKTKQYKNLLSKVDKISFIPDNISMDEIENVKNSIQEYDIFHILSNLIQNENNIVKEIYKEIQTEMKQ